MVFHKVQYLALYYFSSILKYFPFTSSTFFYFHLFAEDSNFFFIADRNLNKLKCTVNNNLNKIKDWLNTNNMSLNIDKSHSFVIFHRLQNSIPNYALNKQSNPIFIYIKCKKYKKYLKAMESC